MFYLVLNGADLEQTDTKGKTALGYLKDAAVKQELIDAAEMRDR